MTRMTRIRTKAKNLGQKDEALENQRSRQQIHFLPPIFLPSDCFTFVLSARIRVIRNPPLLFVENLRGARRIRRLV
jgi:hypothetical protein